MAIYQIQINEKTSLGKSLITFLQSIPQIVTFGRQEKQPSPKSELYESLNRAFCDVRLMMDGKKREKTAEELLYELQNEL
jgi:hypothetical protein